MTAIEITSKLDKPNPNEIVAWIDLGAGKPLALATMLKGHPGWSDVQRRRGRGTLASAYLTSSDAPLLVLPGAIAKAYPDGEKIKTLAAEALAVARERKIPNLTFVLDAPRGGDCAADVAEGLALHAYRFEHYKKPKEPTPDPKIKFVIAGNQRAKASAAIDKRLTICESVNHARDLINEPGTVANPAEIEARARAVAKRAKLKVTVLDAKQLEKEGYGGLLAVGRGSEVPPRMIVLSYDPAGARAKPHLGLLGKGVTFDTGGVSIKPADKMWQMKGDMSGAAAVIYAMEAIAALKPKIRVTGIVVTSQNYVDARSTVPGDIMRARNGKTVQIDNTDAEGRLILTDGLWRASEEKVTHLVDIATLTGAIMRALGSAMSGAFGNDAFADRIVKLSTQAGEPCWRMPLIEEYLELLRCEVADLNNIGSTPNGGAITAALFLREFVPENVSWCHLDIAGTFLADKKTRYYRPGATGVMVRTLTALAQDMAGRGK